MRTAIRLAVAATLLAFAVGAARGEPAADSAPAAAGIGTSADPPVPVESYFGRRLESVSWTGRQAIDTRDLETATGWRAGAVFDASAWQGLAERVAGRYAAAGYLQARVAEVTFDTTAAGLAARVRIEEGSRFRIGEVRIYGGGSEPAVRAALGLRSGDWWSTARVDAALRELVERYRRESRPFTRVHVRSIEPAGEVANLEIVILEADTVWVDSVRVEGLDETSPRLIRRLAREVSGRPFDPRRAESLRRRLLGLGIFASVEGPRLEPASRRRAVLVYRAQELLANSAAGALGYQGSGNKPSGMAELTLGNLAGTARRADLGWQGRGDAGTNFHIAYREPVLPVLGLRADAGFEHELYDTTYVRTRGSLDLLTAGRGSWEMGAGLALERVVSGARGDQQSDRTEYSLRGAVGFFEEIGLGGVPRGVRLRLRGAYATTRDRLIDGSETAGVLWTGSAGVEHGGSAGGRRHYRLALDARARSAAGRPVGLADRFPLGGVATLRGYREDAFRTERYALVRSELGFAAGGARPFLFVDQAFFAAATEPSTGERQIRYRVGYGAGLQQQTGAGRLGLILGWGEGTRPLDAKLHLAFATRF